MPTYLELAYNANYVCRSGYYGPAADIFEYNGRIFMAFANPQDDTVMELFAARGVFLNS